ncbi:LicD family [Phytophthora cactorum]|nr:LicD family [Phytophthora cactorum]
MLPHRVPVAAARRLGAPPRQKIMYYLLCFLGVVTVVQILRFLYGKCDTRVHMSSLLTKTSRILKRNNVEYWLDKGTLLGVHRDDGLIPWEYDVDLGVMNATCAEISALKSEFVAVGLTAYDREDDIPHKVKLTYDTENHEFYWSDPRLHDPCIRVYDTADIATWVDIYWYVELTHEEVTADRENVLVPPGYDEEDSLVCCSEGLQAHTDTCAAEVAYRVSRSSRCNEQPVPAEVAQFPVDSVRRERIDKSRDQGLEGCRVRLLDESVAIYGASGPAQRRAGGARDLLPAPVLHGQLQAAKALEGQRHLYARDKRTSTSGASKCRAPANGRRGTDPGLLLACPLSLTSTWLHRANVAD